MTTYVSVGSSQGKLLNRISDYTVGSLSTNAGDFEVRYAVTNANGNNVRTNEVIWFLRGVIHQLQMGGLKVGARQYQRSACWWRHVATVCRVTPLVYAECLG